MSDDQHPQPMSHDARLDLVRRVAQLRDDADALLWDLVAFGAESGTDLADVADTLGVSRATLYRRLQTRRHAPDG